MLEKYIETIYKVVYLKVSELQSSLSYWFSFNWQWSALRSGHINERMILDGWCSSDIQRLNLTLMSSELCYASMLEPPVYENTNQGSKSRCYINGFFSNECAEVDKPNLGPSNKHQQCSKFSYSAYHYNKMAYKTKHVFKLCVCAQKRVCVSDLVNILDNG